MTTTDPGADKAVQALPELRGDGFWEERMKTIQAECKAPDTPEVWHALWRVRDELERWAISYAREAQRAAITHRQQGVVGQAQRIAAGFPDQLFTGFSNLMEGAKNRGDLGDVAYIKSLRDLFSEVVRAFVHCTPAAPPAQPQSEPQKRDAWRGGDSYEASMLRDLLAVIHRDGGHYVEAHGLDKAIDDARAKVVSRMSALEMLVTAKRAKDEGDHARHDFIKPLAWAAAFAVIENQQAAPAQPPERAAQQEGGVGNARVEAQPRTKGTT